jgi:HAD superfamily hydrolase (TIGR01549 family)
VTLFEGIEGIIFDLDGTLTNYEASSSTGLNYAFNVLSKRFDMIQYDQFRDAYNVIIHKENLKTSSIGIQYAALENRKVRFGKTLKLLDIEGSGVVEEMAQAYGTGRAEGATLYPHVRDVLSGLAKKYKLALLTEGAVSTQMRQIENHGLKHFFFTIVISGETPYHKPSVELFRLTASRLGINPNRIAMVGDRVDWDLIPAKKLGMRTVLFQDESVKSEEDQQNIDVSVKSFREIGKLFCLLEASS